MKTAEEVLKSKLNPAIAIINNADYTFNKVLEAMEEYAKLYHEQKLNIASVVRPEVESAKEGELLATEAKDTATCGVDDNGWNCKRTTEPGGVASQCMNGCILERSSCEG